MVVIRGTRRQNCHGAVESSDEHRCWSQEEERYHDDVAKKEAIPHDPLGKHEYLEAFDEHGGGQC